MKAVTSTTTKESLDTWLSRGNKPTRCPPSLPSLTFRQLYSIFYVEEPVVEREPNGRRRRRPKRKPPRR